MGRVRRKTLQTTASMPSEQDRGGNHEITNSRGVECGVERGLKRGLKDPTAQQALTRRGRCAQKLAIPGNRTIKAAVERELRTPVEHDTRKPSTQELVTGFRCWPDSKFRGDQFSERIHQVLPWGPFTACPAWRQANLVVGFSYPLWRTTIRLSNT